MRYECWFMFAIIMVGFSLSALYEGICRRSYTGFAKWLSRQSFNSRFTFQLCPYFRRNKELLASLYCVAEGDAAWILLRSGMEDGIELFLQEHVL